MTYNYYIRRLLQHIQHKHTHTHIHSGEFSGEGDGGPGFRFPKRKRILAVYFYILFGIKKLVSEISYVLVMIPKLLLLPNSTMHISVSRLTIIDCKHFKI